MSDREALVRSRGGYNGVITKWINRIDSAIAAGNVNTLSSIKDLIMKQMKTVHDLNEKILALTTEEDRMKEVEEQAEYEVVIGEHWCKLINAITAISGNGSPGNPPTTPKTNVRLPKLDLPHFTGDVLEWNSFWELYNVSVHKRGDLELIQKFSYLQSLLTGNALKLISRFKLEAANYSQAIFLLQATYGKKDEIKRVLVRRILEMESPSPDSESLQSFRANFECSIRSLESENLELNELYTILLHVNQSQSVRPKSKGNVNKFSSQQTRKCVLCEGEHWWTQCKTYASRDKKLSRLGFLRLSFVCASNKHFSVDCEKQICGNGCRLKHHCVLCDKQQTSEPSKSTTKSASKPNNNGVQVGTLSVSDQSQKSRQRSILPTATIVLKGKDIWYAFVDYWTLVRNEPLSEDELPEYTKKFNVKRNLKTLCRTKICLADKDFDLPVDKQAPIDMLVGVDNVYNILHPGFRKAGKLILLPTIFGYVVTGSCNAPPMQETQNLDKVGIDCNELKEHNRKVLEDFESTIVYSEMKKQYVVALPWKSNKPRLPSNFGMALGRVKQQCAKFQKDEAYLNHYLKS
ncbi:uncharacterized protein [Palaemon carinicauda]|uniref:uncharacterized protein n=1 Tax=Palaemon carinicauda TaxID=392227 RepID=UPI0035B6018E